MGGDSIPHLNSQLSAVVKISNKRQFHKSMSHHTPDVVSSMELMEVTFSFHVETDGKISRYCAASQIYDHFTKRIK
jgi:hypothetical protein